MISPFPLYFLHFGPVRYLIFNVFLFPHHPPVNIVIYFQLHIFLLVMDDFLTVLFHHLQHIVRKGTIFQSLVYLVEFYSIAMLLFLLLQSLNQCFGFVFSDLFPFLFLFLNKLAVILFGEWSLAAVIRGPGSVNWSFPWYLCQGFR